MLVTEENELNWAASTFSSGSLFAPSPSLLWHMLVSEREFEKERPTIVHQDLMQRVASRHHG
jgi:hypothetical protein